MKTSAQYEKAIKALLFGKHPVGVNVKKVKGQRNNDYRIRLGKYRVVYTVVGGKIIAITTLLAGSRGDIYKKISH
ncbi:MAG: type II toxin-antitoxin system RelE/ParE family toxin [Eubacteriaceae bacterium]|nr:type II toxin-antitoxin system RelE/ParE family toxin [Eubacteriaceae bacterium]